MANEKHFMVVDTETTGLAEKAFVFDIGYVIGTRKTIKLERSFLVRDVITNPQIMLTALFNEDWRAMFGGKIFRHYIPALDAQKLRLHGWQDILATMRDDALTHNVNVFSAYNLRFDLGAIQRTNKKLVERHLNFKPFDLLCLWEFACTTIFNTRLYHDVARQQSGEWITPADNVRTNAEKAYAFLTGQLEFVESHTALEDAQIEFEILQRLLARKKTIPYNVLDHMPWRKAQNLKGRLF